jgi:hypothetical protein
MATIMDTLFGVSAERFQQERDAAADAQALQYARLSPIEKASFGVQRGAYGLAGALGGALGGTDPELQRRTQAQQILGMIDPSKPETFFTAAQIAADRGDQQLAFGLRLEGDKYKQEAAMNKALIGQREASATASLAAAGREAKQGVDKDIQVANELSTIQDTLDQLRNLPASPERDREINLQTTRFTQLERLTTKEQKEKYSTFGQGLIDAGLTPGTEPFIKRMNEYLNSQVEGTKKGTGNVTIGGINLDTGAAGKAASKIIGENVANVENQFSLQTAYKDALTLLNQGIYGGAFGPEKQFVAKYTGVGSPEKVRNTEVFMANIGEIVIPRLVQFGGNDSNEELKYLQNVVAGNQRLEPESMKRILASAEKKVQKNIERLRVQTQAGQTGSPLPITPVSTPTQTPTKRWNPQTRKLDTVTGE